MEKNGFMTFSKEVKRKPRKEFEVGSPIPFPYAKRVPGILLYLLGAVRGSLMQSLIQCS